MMEVSKEKTHTYASKLSNIISKPKMVFAKDYSGYDWKKREKVYFQVLHEIYQAVSFGNAEVLEKCGDLIDRMQGVEDGEKLKYYYDNVDNPFRETNVIIQACKSGSAEIIECLFANGGKLLKNISGNIGSCSTLPSAKNGDCHNCIYYAIRSNNVKLLDNLVKKWPGDYFVNHPEDLDDVISKAYKELRLKNVLISTEMKYFVENVLIDVRFFLDGSTKTDRVPKTQEIIVGRIEIMLKYIKVLNEEYTKEEKLDSKILSLMKFIASNIHILKSQLKSTYGRIPWEEIEFCLVCYVLSRTTKNYINLYFHVVLGREKLLRHLQCFSECLEKEMSNIKNSDVNKLRKPVDLKRKNVITDISRNHPLFVEMYDDYDQIRDVYSMVKMRTYIDLAVTADCREKEGQLVVMRALQVIGEHLKNTLESPKLSEITSEILLLTVAPFTREILTSLRNSLSHADSLSKRAEIDGEFFTSIQDDVKKIGAEIGHVLRERETNIIRKVLEKFVERDGFEEAKQIKEAWQYIGPDQLFLSGLERTKFDFIEEIIEKLSFTIGDKTIYEKELFKRINELLISEKKKSEDSMASKKMGYETIKGISAKLNNYSLNFRTLRAFKSQAKDALENITPSPQLMVDSKLALLISDIYSSAKPRMKGDKRVAMNELNVKFINIFTFKTDNAKWIERFDERISVKKSKRSTVSLMNKEKYVSLLKEDFLLLQNILKRYDICTHSVENIAFHIRNKKLQAVLEMLLLDIMSILDILKESREHSHIFLDDDLPLLMGKFLRNHLAHGNVLMDVLCSDPAIALVSNALKLNSENLIEKNGKLVTEDPSRIGNRMNHDIDVIINQERMFSALEKGNYEELMTCVKKGADIWARNHNMWTSLHFAAKAPSLKIVKYVLDHNVNVNAKDINGQSPLHVAANFGRTCIAEFIIQERSVDFNERDTYGKTPLDIAAENGHKGIVEILLKHTSKTYYTDEMMYVYHSPVYHAVKNNQFDVAVQLLEREENVDATHSTGGYTLLYTAAEEGFAQLVKFLLERKACPNSRCDKHGTPLHSASLYGHSEVVRTLVMYGADINAKCMNGLTPLHNAVEYGHEEIAKFLLEHGADVNIAGKCYRNTPLHLAALYGYTGVVDILLIYKANVNSETVEGSTPLHFAAMSGHSTIVDILIKHKASVNASNSHGQTAVHLSSLHGHQNIVSLLLKNGARLNDKDENGRCSLHMASVGGCRRIVEVLISGGAEPNAKDINGQTPLHLSALNAHTEVLEILLRKGVFINSTDEMGYTPLHLAVYEKVDEKIVEYLLSKGADANVKNLIGMTPLHTASLFGKMKVIEALLEAGANVNLEGGKHYTPLRMSVTGNHKEIVEYLISKGANVNCGFENGSTPLCDAVRSNYHDIAKTLVSKGADVNLGKPLHMAVLAGSKSIVFMLLKQESINLSVTPGDPDDFTLLHCAAVRGRANIVEALLAKGIYVDPIGRANATPLHHAVNVGDEEITEILLKNGANVNHESTDGTVLHIASPKGYNAVVEVLLRYGANVNIVDSKNRTPLQLAVANNRVKVVEVLNCHKETDIHSRDKNDWNLLHIAASKGHLDMVKLLFEHKVDARSKNDKGSKPIHLAARDGHTNIVDFFLNHGIDINDRGYLGSTLLHYAAHGDSVEVARYLIGKYCNVNAVDGVRRTPLHTAAILGNVKILVYLLSKGASYNARDILRKRPLDLACNPEVLKLLTSTENLFVAVRGNNASKVEKCVKDGAFIDAKSNDDSTVLHHAAWKGHEKVINVLLKSKANPNVIGKNGYTPLHYAAKFGHFEIVKALLSNGATYNSASTTCKTPLDFAIDKDIVNLLELVDAAFNDVKKGNANIIEELKNVKDAERVKAVMNCCNGDGRSLVLHAIHSNFPKVEGLKQMLMEEFSAQICNAKEMHNAENFEESCRIFEDVIQKMNAGYGPNNPATLEIQKELAKIQYSRKDFKGALSVSQEIHERQKTLLGEKCRDTLSTRSIIALILHRLGKDYEALEIFEEVYSSQKELLGESDPDTLDTQYHMALPLNSVGRYEEAFENNVQYYEKSKAMLGDDDPQTILAQNNVAIVLSNLGKLEEALQTYQNVLRSKIRVFGSSHSSTLRTLHSMAWVLSKQGRVDECLEAYQEVYKRQKEKLGKFHLDTLQTQFTIGNVMFSQGKFLGALKAYKEGFDRRKEMLGPDHPDVMITELKMDILNFNLQMQGVNESESLRFVQNEVCDIVNTKPQ